MTTHYLDHPERGETKVLNGWSYLGGALLGPLYVLYHRFAGPALLMLVYTAVIAAAAAGLCTLIAVLSDEPALIFIGVAGIGVLALATQGAAAVELVRRAYIREGYREGYY